MNVRKIEFETSNFEEMLNFREENRESFEHAYSYLTMWAMSLYDLAQIYFDSKEYEFTAKYTNTEKNKKYVIGGIWHEDDKRFSFHS